MSFLPIVERELRVASRRPATYWLRLFLALAVFVIWFFLLVLGQGSVPVVQRGQILFQAIGVIALAFSLLAGVFLTADCLSEEKREGTLGLLFLTDLKGYDVVLGKLIATSLHAFYGLLAVLPLLALPLLLGGVTVAEFWRISVALLTTLFVSLSLGMAVSAVSRDTRQAMAATLLVLLLAGGIMPLLWWLLTLLLKHPGCDFLRWPSPPYLYLNAFDSHFQLRSGAQAFWASLRTLLLMGGGALVLASLYLPRAWHDSGADSGAAAEKGWRRRWRFGSREFCLARRRILEQNPFHWLASRDRLPKVMGSALTGSLIPIWLCFLAGCFSQNRTTKDVAFTVVMFMAYGLHLLLKLMVAIEVSRRLSEDQLSGALELLLVSPLSVPQILRGQRRALWQIFRGPILLTLLTNLGLCWLLLGPNPMHMDGDGLIIFCEMYAGGALLLFVDFYALSWVGMWMALQTRRHHRAVFATIARVMLTPCLMIVFLVFLTIGGRNLTQEAVKTLAVLWFGLSAVIALAFAHRAKSGLLETQ
jgi:ABC-type transport system involved in multi-copper enzyme maturation permease subunit